MAKWSTFGILRGADEQQSRVQDNINAVLSPVAKALQNTPIMGAASPAWATASLLNGWTNAIATEPVQYFRDALGFVHFRGGLVAGTFNQPCLTLPPGLRPGGRKIIINSYAYNGAPTTCYTEVRLNGDVWLGPFALTTNVQLDCVSFLAEA